MPPLHDIRPMPPVYDVHAKTADEAIAYLRTGEVTAISLDHDLATEHYAMDTLLHGPKTGYDVACFIEEGARTGAMRPMAIRIHSMNPVGVEKMRRAIENARRYWQQSSIT